MATGFSAMRSGIVMFAIPFIFAFYPELLLIDQALVDPSSPTGAALPGYENGIEMQVLIWLILRLFLALYLIASALVAFDARHLSPFWIAIRLGTAVAVLAKPEAVQFPAIAFAVVLLAIHHVGARRMRMAEGS